ncbi:MAG: ABC transporter ATP-binding protein [Nevskiales bacterium]
MLIFAPVSAAASLFNTVSVILEVRNLTKHYAAVKAVNGVSFKVMRGQCFGLLGPNGAGKTTTVEIMEGISRPSSGEVLYKDEALGKRFKQESGIQFQSTALQDYLTVEDQIRLFASFYDHPMPFDELVRLCALEELLQRDSRFLSGGQHQRLLLAIALVNDPEVVFLDEPTTGLDPQARRNFWDLVNGIKARDKTVVLTTHYMEEAYRLCDEIAIMDHGQIIAQGSPDELLTEHFADVVVELPREEFPLDIENFPLPLLQKPGAVEILTHDVNATIETLLAQGISLQRLEVRPRTLEDLFLQLTGKELRS